MIQATSAAAHDPRHKMRRRSQCWRILSAMRRYGALTIAEIVEYTGIAVNVVCWRLRDLRVAGVIDEFLKRPCRTNGLTKKTFYFADRRQLTLFRAGRVAA